MQCSPKGYTKIGRLHSVRFLCYLSICLNTYLSLRSSFINIRIEALSTLLRLLEIYHPILTHFISPHTVHSIRTSTHSLDSRRTSVQDIASVNTLVSSIVRRIEISPIPSEAANCIDHLNNSLDLRQLTNTYDEDIIQYAIGTEK